MRACGVRRIEGAAGGTVGRGYAASRRAVRHVLAAADSAAFNRILKLIHAPKRCKIVGLTGIRFAFVRDQLQNIRELAAKPVRIGRWAVSLIAERPRAALERLRIQIFFLYQICIH